jgi:hypothetical protein
LPQQFLRIVVHAGQLLGDGVLRPVLLLRQISERSLPISLVTNLRFCSVMVFKLLLISLIGVNLIGGVHH